jgi:hypothetical protein
MQPQIDNRIAFRTIRDLQELGTLREFWESRPGTRDSDFDFFSALVRSRGQDCRPHVIVLSRNAAPDAIMIGLREHRKMPFKLGFVTICQPEVNVLEFVSGGLRGSASESNCTAFVHEVMRSLDKGEADLARWEQLIVQSPLYQCALRIPRFVLRDHSGCPEDHWLRNFPKGLDSFFMSLCRSQRSKLRRKYKKVLNCFPEKAQVRCFRSLGDLEPAISDVEEIAGKTDKRRLGFGFFNTPQTRKHLAAVAERGWLRIYVLYLEEKPAAFWIGTLYNRCLQADYAGYNPIWSKFSPGIFLFLNILEDLRDEDIKTIDFGWGNTQLNHCFGDRRQVEAEVQVYAPTLRGLQLSMLRATTQRTNALIRRIRVLEGARRALWRYVARLGRTQDANAGWEAPARGRTHEQKSLVHGK